MVARNHADYTELRPGIPTSVFLGQGPVASLAGERVNGRLADDDEDDVVSRITRVKRALESAHSSSSPNEGGGKCQHVNGPAVPDCDLLSLDDIVSSMSEYGVTEGTNLSGDSKGGNMGDQVSNTSMVGSSHQTPLDDFPIDDDDFTDGGYSLPSEDDSSRSRQMSAPGAILASVSLVPPVIFQHPLVPPGMSPTNFHTADRPVPPNEPVAVAPVVSDPRLDSSTIGITERVLLRLYDLLRHVGSPLYVLDHIIDILREETHNNGFDIRKPIMRRKTFLKKIARRFPVSDPEKIPVRLESITANETTATTTPDLTYVLRFSAKQQIEDLLHDESVWGDAKNFVGCVNDETPFDRYIPPEGKLDEIVDGAWYKRTWDLCHDIIVKEGNNEPFMVIPLVLYLDKTGTDRYMRHGMEPVLLMMGLLNRRARNNDRCKRILGYLPDLELSSSATKKADKSDDALGRSSRDWHKCAQVIFDDLASAQGFESRVVHVIRIHNLIKVVRVFMPVAFVINDGQSADKMVGRYTVSHKTKHPCRSCNINYDNLDDPEFECEPLEYALVALLAEQALKLSGRMSMEEKDKTWLPHTKEGRQRKLAKIRDRMKNMSRHVVELSTCNLHFGHQINQIFAATPVDLMHAFLHGVLQYCIKIYIAPMTAKEKAELDSIIKEIIAGVRSSEKMCFPRSSFTRGMTNLKLLTAEEWAGLAFTLVLVHVSDVGATLFQKVYDRRTKPKKVPTQKKKRQGNNVGTVVPKENADKNKSPKGTKRKASSSLFGEEEEQPSTIVCDPDSFLYILEMMLCFYSFYRSDQGVDGWEENGIEQKLRDALQTMLSDVVKHLPRVKGAGWKLQKFHDLLHLPWGMSEYGSPMNFDAGNGERALKHFVKNIVTTCQKRGQIPLMEQAAKRIKIDMSLNRALQCLPEDSKALRRYRVNHILAGRMKDVRMTTNTDLGKLLLLQSNLYAINPPPLHAVRNKDTGVEMRSDTPIIKWHNPSDRVKGVREIHPSVVNWFLRDSVIRKYGSRSIECFTEYINGKGILIRAHPNYRSEGQWYDWVDVLWGDTIYPARVMCFFVDPVTRKQSALVQSCDKKAEDMSSVTTSIWHLESHRTSSNSCGDTNNILERYQPTYRKIEAECIDQCVFAIEEEVPIVEERVVLIRGESDPSEKNPPDGIHLTKIGDAKIREVWKAGQVVETRCVDPDLQQRDGTEPPGVLVRTIWKEDLKEDTLGPRVIVAKDMRTRWSRCFLEYETHSNDLEDPGEEA